MSTRADRRRARARRAFSWLARGAAMVARIVAERHHEDDDVAWHASTAAASLDVAAEALSQEPPR